MSAMLMVLKFAVITVLVKIGFEHWLALWRDVKAAPSARAVLGYLLRPPGWRPGGAGETTEELRQVIQAQGVAVDPVVQTPMP